MQFARLVGARVIGTAQAKDEGLLRELGADEVIDYTATRFEAKVADVDVVFDPVGGDTLERSWRVLRPGGVLVTIAGEFEEQGCSKITATTIRIDQSKIFKAFDSGIVRHSASVRMIASWSHPFEVTG